MGAPLSEQECRARLTNWCSSCSIMDFASPGYELGDELGDTATTTGCITDYGFGSGYNSGCDCNGGAPCTHTADQLRDFCAAFTP